MAQTRINTVASKPGITAIGSQGFMLERIYKQPVRLLIDFSSK
jgi:hypothetical protein